MRFCLTHTLAYDRQRAGPRQRGYDYDHERWRCAVLERDGYRCVDCGSSERLNADHIDPNGARHDLANGATRCASCHARKTAMRDGGWGNARRVARDGG
jgi:5-methylcytosine-specific restriction endonuclease McrA